MSRILDCDKMVTEDRYYILKGRKITIPGDIDVRQIIQLTKLAQEMQKNPSAMEDSISQVWDILKSANPNISEDQFYDGLTFKRFMKIYAAIMNEDSIDLKEEPEEGEVFDNSKNVSGKQKQPT